jgi:hypothetical protein
LTIDPDAIAGFDRPLLLAEGDRKPKSLRRIVELLARTLPAGTGRRSPGAVHPPSLTSPSGYADAVAELCLSRLTRRRRLTR